jgi:S-formylglutathione hydrolase FrmB
MTVIRNLSIVTWGFRAALVGVAVALLASSFWFRHLFVRWGARLLTLAVAVAFVGATINAHFGYFPTVGALLGRQAADQMSLGAFRRIARPVERPLRATGVVLKFAMPGTVSHFPARIGEVYLPPIWFDDSRPHLPVIELLHGSPGSPPDWTRASFADLTADKFARAHGGYAPILVMPDVNGVDWWHDSECVDGVQGNAETYLTVDVRNAVVRTVGARPDGASWGIAGLSEGGSCALQMGLRHPDLFSVVGDFSGDDHPFVGGGLAKLFLGSTTAQLVAAERSYDPRWLLQHWSGSDAPAIVFATGRSDDLLAKMLRLLSWAHEDHMQTRLEVLPGGHEFRFWGASFASALPWMMRHLRVANHPQFASARHVSCSQRCAGSSCIASCRGSPTSAQR